MDALRKFKGPGWDFETEEESEPPQIISSLISHRVREQSARGNREILEGFFQLRPVIAAVTQRLGRASQFISAGQVRRKEKRAPGKYHF